MTCEHVNGNGTEKEEEKRHMDGWFPGYIIDDELSKFFQAFTPVENIFH